MNSIEDLLNALYQNSTDTVRAAGGGLMPSPMQNSPMQSTTSPMSGGTQFGGNSMPSTGGGFNKAPMSGGNQQFGGPSTFNAAPMSGQQNTFNPYMGGGTLSPQPATQFSPSNQSQNPYSPGSMQSIDTINQLMQLQQGSSPQYKQYAEIVKNQYANNNGGTTPSLFDPREGTGYVSEPMRVQWPSPELKGFAKEQYDKALFAKQQEQQEQEQYAKGIGGLPQLPQMPQQPPQARTMQNLGGFNSANRFSESPAYQRFLMNQKQNSMARQQQSQMLQNQARPQQPQQLQPLNTPSNLAMSEKAKLQQMAMPNEYGNAGRRRLV